MPEEHWVIDVVAEQVATLEAEDGRLVTVARALLPPGAAEGQVVRVTLEGSQPVRIVADGAATLAALRHSADQLRPRPGAPVDPGGDLTI